MPEKEIKKSSNIEREYVIPLRKKYQHVPRYKKTPKAVKSIKEFLVRHMKIYDRNLNKIKIDRDLNEFLWMRGIKNPPHKIKVKAVKEGENVIVKLIDYPDRLKFKKAREEKIEKETKEAVEKKKSLKEKIQEQVRGKKEVSEDENKDGVEDKKEIKEKRESVKEAGEKMEKAQAKKAKHSFSGKTKEPKRPVRQAMAK